MLRHRLDRLRYPDAVKLAIARDLRQRPTPTERFAWSLLRRRGVLGLKFRRQHIVCGFIVDLYCPTLRLVLELDGNQHLHQSQLGYDTARTAVLESRGYSVIRMNNNDVSRKRLVEVLLPLVQRHSFLLSR